MAIVQASMAEEILNRSERAVIRGIYRASQLAEAKASLQKTVLALESFGTASNNAGQPTLFKEHVKSIEEYLSNAISVALVSTKVPASRKPESDNPNPGA